MSVLRFAWSRRALGPIVWVGVVGALTTAALAPPGGKGNGNADVLELTGVARDFLPVHPDFDVRPPDGFGHYMWNIAKVIGEGNKPVYAGGGFKVRQQAHDASGRPICWTLYDSDLGDTPAVPDGPDSGSITSAETFDQWFHDILGVNTSTLVTISGVYQNGGQYAGMYEFNIPQFYPIDGLLFGNDSDHNNYFTFEIAAEFVYDASAGYEFYFKSDDDAWVFIDGQLVADLGGINGSPEQWVELDRLGLVDGETHMIRFFKADRSDTSSRFHLVTNVPLQSLIDQTILALFD